MGQNIIEMTPEQNEFLFKTVCNIVNKFQILNNIEMTDKFKFINEFTDDLYYNLMLKKNKLSEPTIVC